MTEIIRDGNLGLFCLVKPVGIKKKYLTIVLYTGDEFIREVYVGPVGTQLPQFYNSNNPSK